MNNSVVIHSRGAVGGGEHITTKSDELAFKIKIFRNLES